MNPSDHSDDTSEPAPTAPGVGAVFAALRRQDSGHGEGADRVRTGRLGGGRRSIPNTDHHDPDEDETV